MSSVLNSCAETDPVARSQAQAVTTLRSRLHSYDGVDNGQVRRESAQVNRDTGGATARQPTSVSGQCCFLSFILVVNGKFAKLPSGKVEYSPARWQMLHTGKEGGRGPSRPLLCHCHQDRLAARPSTHLRLQRSHETLPEAAAQVQQRLVAALGSQALDNLRSDRQECGFCGKPASQHTGPTVGPQTAASAHTHLLPMPGMPQALLNAAMAFHG
jgi:hypothetical protein